MTPDSKILLTGAAGIVGTALRPFLADEFDQVLLTDIRDVTKLAKNESFERGDITDLNFVRNLAANVNGIVHLAGLVGANHTFDEVLGTNVIGTHNIFAAAQESGIDRIVNASSHHTVGFLRRGVPIDESTAPRPNGEYALSKAFGESAAAYFADNFALNILTIRIGFLGAEVANERRLHTWTSARDLAQLVAIGLSDRYAGHEIVYGVSEVPEPFFDNNNATRLGYRPQDRAVDFVTDPAILKTEPDLSSLSEALVGGGFAEAGFAGDINYILGKALTEPSQ